MHLCPRCGHTSDLADAPFAARAYGEGYARVESSPTIWVDATVLACLNRAHEIASETRARQVDIAHVLLAMTQHDGAMIGLRNSAIDVVGLAQLMSVHVDRLAGPDPAPTRPMTAANLHTLLHDAGQLAIRRGATAIEISDIVETLTSVQSYVSQYSLSHSKIARTAPLASVAGTVSEYALPNGLQATGHVDDRQDENFDLLRREILNAAEPVEGASETEFSFTEVDEADRLARMREELAGDMAHHAALGGAAVSSVAHLADDIAPSAPATNPDDVGLARFEQLLIQQDETIARLQSSLIEAQDKMVRTVHEAARSATQTNQGSAATGVDTNAILERLDALQGQLSEVQSAETSEGDDTLVERIEALTLRLGQGDLSDSDAEYNSGHLRRNSSARVNGRLRGEGPAANTQASVISRTGAKRVKRLRSRLRKTLGSKRQRQSQSAGMERMERTRSDTDQTDMSRSERYSSEGLLTKRTDTALSSSRTSGRTTSQSSGGHNYDSVPRISRSRTSPAANDGRSDFNGERTTHDSSRSDHGARTSKLHHKQAAQIVVETRQTSTTEAEETRFFLSLSDDIVDCPSIGPKTSERFRPAHIFTVADFLSADVEETAQLIDARHITEKVLRTWQDQSRLVCTIPGLRGTHAQLLVGAGYRSAAEIVAEDDSSVYAAVLAFANTREGQSVLRNGPPPDMEKVFTWISNARQAQPERLVA